MRMIKTAEMASVVPSSFTASLFSSLIIADPYMLMRWVKLYGALTTYSA